MNLIPLTISLSLATTIGISYLQTSQDKPQIVNYRAGLLEFQDNTKQLLPSGLTKDNFNAKQYQYCDQLNDVFKRLFPKDIKGSVNFRGNDCEIVKLSIQAKADKYQDNKGIFSNLLQAAQASAISANSIVDNQHIHWLNHRYNKKTYNGGIKSTLKSNSKCISCTLGKNRTEKIIDGGWSQWSDCSETSCGIKGTQKRTCDNPQPNNGGLNCQGTDARTCKAPCIITDKHTAGISIDEHFNFTNEYKNQEVEIIIADDAALIAPNTSKCALSTGTDYKKLTIINKGTIYGHGGNGGNGGIANQSEHYKKWMGQDGTAGGPAICVETDITLVNRGTIAGGGGGGGGGSSAFDGKKNEPKKYAAGGGGGGGGYPNGIGGDGGFSTRASTASDSKLVDDLEETTIKNDYPHGRDGKDAADSNPGKGGSNGINQKSSRSPNNNNKQYFTCKSSSYCAQGGMGGQGGNAGEKGKDANTASSQKRGNLGTTYTGKGGCAGTKYKIENTSGNNYKVTEE